MLLVMWNVVKTLAMPAFVRTTASYLLPVQYVKTPFSGEKVVADRASCVQ
jgi:hypothetical protein